MDPQRALGVFVLGMHRSGTSVVARLLNLLGFSLGPEDQLLLGRSNPTGFWENANFIRANRELLRVLGGYWTAPPALERGWEERSELETLLPENRRIADLLFGHGQWACKEPRACLTFPYWRRLMDDRPLAIVLIYRNPLEVAGSLAVRDGLSPAVGLALWERYSRSALACARGYPVYVTSCEDVLLDPLGWSADVARFLAEQGGAPTLPPGGEVTSFVRPELRQSILPASSLDSHELVSGAQSELFLALESARGSHGLFTAPDLCPETTWVEPLLAERRSALGWEQTAKRQAAVIARIQSRRGFRAALRLRALGRFVTAVVDR